MNAIRILAIVLIVAGAAALAYGSFSFTKETHDVSVGPVEFSMSEKETVNVPNWLGIGAIALGLVLLVVRRKG
jgi:hypothetical protein